MIRKILLLVIIALIKVDDIKPNRRAVVSQVKLSRYCELVDLIHLQIIGEEINLNVFECGGDTLKILLAETLAVDICAENVELFTKLISFETSIMSFVEEDAFEEITEQPCNFCEENQKNALDNQILAAEIFGSMITLGAGYIIYQRCF